MQCLGHEYDFDPGERRIRCAAHAINLAVQSMLYGNKRDNFEELVESLQEPVEDETNKLDDVINSLFDAEDDEYDEIERAIEAQESFQTSTEPNMDSLLKYRKYGPLGKLHNIGVFMRRSSQIQEDFFLAQASIDPKTVPISLGSQRVRPMAVR